MKDRVTKISERFEAFSLRERALISAAIVVLVFMVWDTMLLSPQEIRQTKVVREIHGLNKEMEGISRQVKVMTSKLSGDDLKHIQARTGELSGLLAELERKEHDLTVQFIRPEQMAKVLEDMLGSESSLKLTRLESLGVTPLFPPTKEGKQAVANTENKEAGKQSSIFKHSMRVVFEGDFNGTLAYLQALESMPWRFYWDNVEYEVLKYPLARVVITVHTLSLDEGWIGV